jgi:hypothetical protein
MRIALQRGIWALAAVWLSFGAAPPRIAAAADNAPEPGFSMMVASDTQLTWWRDGDPDCTSNKVWYQSEWVLNGDSCVDARGKQTNREQVAAINRITELGSWPNVSAVGHGAGSAISAPKGVIVNGDLVSAGHAPEWGMFEDLWGADQVHYPRYLGLGNHDYENYVNDCVYRFDFDGDKNRCPKEALWRLGQMLDSSPPGLVNRDWPVKIAVANRAGFWLRTSVDYVDGGQKRSDSTGSYVSGEWRGFSVPWTARASGVKFEAWNGSSWLTIRSVGMTAAKTACWQATGSLSADNSQTVHVDSADCPREWPGTASGSAAYSFDVQKQDEYGDFTYHFVQLNNWPGYAVELPRATTPYNIGAYEAQVSPGISVTTSYDWLKKDLAAATRAGKRSVINFHEVGYSRSASNQLTLDDPKLLDVMKGQNVVAMFGGHIHQDYGYMGALALTANDGSTRQVPVFRSGSSECQKFLLVDFRRRYFNVGVVSSANGAPAFESSHTVCDDRWWSDMTKYDAIEKYASNGALSSIGSYALDNKPPTISLANTPTGSIVEGFALQATAEASDPDFDPITLTWDFGDGTTATGSRPLHVYGNQGTYPVKVTASDGFGGEASATLTVNVAYFPPHARLEGGAIGDDGKVRLKGTIEDGAHDSHTLNVDWGDGQAAEKFTYKAGETAVDVGHDYGRAMPGVVQANRYDVVIVATDDDGASFTSHATFERAAPRLSVPASVTIFADLGASISGTVSSVNSGENFNVSVDWGDGKSDSLPVRAGASSFKFQHAYPAVGPSRYAARVSAFGEHNLVTTADVTASRIVSVAPTVYAEPTQINTKEGQPFTVTGRISDPVAHVPMTLVIRWGDGADETQTIAAGQTTFSATHTLSDSRPAGYSWWQGYSVPLILTTPDGRSAVNNFLVNVSNVAPTAALVAPAKITAGQSFDLNVTKPSDPSQADTEAGFKYAFDCGTGAGYSAASTRTSVTCPATAASGPLTVRAKIIDQDLAETAYSASVQVDSSTPAAPTGTVELCTDASYGGRCQAIAGSIASLFDLGLNDQTSSIRITGAATVAVYVNVNYSGPCQTLTSSDPWLGDAPIGNDSISSVKVGAACP